MTGDQYLEKNVKNLYLQGLLKYVWLQNTFYVPHIKLRNYNPGNV